VSLALQLMVRFLLGGAIVSCFALLAEALKPKTFAGLFSGAPSVAVVSLALTGSLHGVQLVAIEARAMALGAVALLAYSAACVASVRKPGLPVWLAAGLCWAVWLFAALALRAWALAWGGA